jgi:hypothetical protein
MSINWLCAALAGLRNSATEMGIGKFAQVDELPDPLSPVELHLGRTVGEQNTPQLALAGEMIEL